MGETRRERVEREDLVMFINASFACSRQQEFYSDVRGQSLSIEFLHAYILGNYRRLYARTLAAGINHFNQAQVVVNLLASGSPASTADRREEGALIAAALRALPPQRVFQIFGAIRRGRVNNRRTRAVIRDYLTQRPDPVFDAVKYRAKLRAVAAHTHSKPRGEVGTFLFELSNQRKFETPLLERFRQAHYDARAIYDLPYTVAQGLAAKQGVPAGEFLAQIQPKMTAGEKLRAQTAAARVGEKVPFNLAGAGLTRLALYVLSLPLEERQKRSMELDAALTRAAARVLRSRPCKLGKVAAVLDSSRSMSGSSQKKRRPLGVALAASYLLRLASNEYRAFWTTQWEHEVLAQARGQTGLANPLLEALEWGAELVVIVSDGFENEPPAGAAEVARLFRQRIDPSGNTELVHMNPVFDHQHYAPKPIGAALPTVGIRDAEDIPTMLGFARFADGAAPLGELETYLAHRVREFLKEARHEK